MYLQFRFSEVTPVADAITLNYREVIFSFLHVWKNLRHFEFLKDSLNKKTLNRIYMG